MRGGGPYTLPRDARRPMPITHPGGDGEQVSEESKSDKPSERASGVINRMSEAKHLMNEGHPKEALAVLEEILNGEGLTPIGRRLALKLEGDVYLMLAQYDYAKQVLEYGLRLFPDDGGFYNRLLEVQLHASAAPEQIERAVEVGRQTGDQYLLALALQTKGETDKAIEQWEQYLQWAGSWEHSYDTFADRYPTYDEFEEELLGPDAGARLSEQQREARRAGYKVMLQMRSEFPDFWVDRYRAHQAKSNLVLLKAKSSEPEPDSEG